MKEPQLQDLLLFDSGFRLACANFLSELIWFSHKMAGDQQVALTRPHRMPPTSTHISKAARQVVPAFLQKLYEYVFLKRISFMFSVSRTLFLEWSTIQTMQNSFGGQRLVIHFLVSSSLQGGHTPILVQSSSRS